MPGSTTGWMSFYSIFDLCAGIDRWRNVSKKLPFHGFGLNGTYAGPNENNLIIESAWTAPAFGYHARDWLFSPVKLEKENDDQMKKLLAIVLGLGVALGTVSFAQDKEGDKKDGDKKSDKKGKKKKGDDTPPAGESDKK
jgi:hypothetical protein